MNTQSIWIQNWDKGLKPHEYLASMSTNAVEFKLRVDSYLPPPINDSIIVTKVAVLTEDWCGDSLNYTPVLLAISSRIPQIDLRLFPRESFPEIRDAFLSGGKSKIPVFVFMDDDFKELGLFIERPLSANRYLGSLVRGTNWEQMTDEEKQPIKKQFLSESVKFQPDVEKTIVGFLTGKPK